MKPDGRAWMCPNQKGEIMEKRMRNIFLAITVCAALALGSGCSTTSIGTNMNKPETGLGGSGIGALLDQACSGNTTLTGSGVGAGLGYLIGNESDKKGARTRQAVTEQETLPLANTAWQVMSVNPKPAGPMKSMTGRFNPDGTLTTTTTYWNGRTVTDTDSERYRIVGETLIINQDDYVINATFVLDGDSLYLDTGSYSLVLERMLTTATSDNGSEQPVVVPSGLLIRAAR
jgi:hypothetical protein